MIVLMRSVFSKKLKWQWHASVLWYYDICFVTNTSLQVKTGARLDYGVFKIHLCFVNHMTESHKLERLSFFVLLVRLQQTHS